jgi:hypothetical protein
MADEEDGAIADAAATAFLDKAREMLAPFLAQNPAASVGPVHDLGDDPGIRSPWGDESLAITLPGGDAALERLAAAMNGVVLPERLSAVWHVADQALEVIWTAYQLLPTQKEIDGRKFTFIHEKVVYECEFGSSSDMLLEMARHTIPISMSESNWRNMHSFCRYTTNQGREGDDEQLYDLDKPRSFWVRNFDLTRDDAFDVIQHLNFYLTYYDDRSPYVFLHNQEPPSTIKPRVRYVSERFPETINSRPLDDILLNFWVAVQEARDVVVRFLYCFRIIEYASFFYLEASAKSSVRKILSAPDAADNISVLTERLISALNESKLDEYAQFNSIIKDTVDAKKLWREMSQNIDAFCAETIFDGGFRLAPLVAANCSEDQFIVRGVETFAKSIKDIRNALSHGRDKKSTFVITATQRNLNLLRPWLNLIELAAGEVLLYKDVA